MPCTHKFFGCNAHLAGENGLLPNWDADTLIIGTFNPSNEWVPLNQANYFYGRSQYFWKILPEFACLDAIENNNVNNQANFLQLNHIALTDLLISIDDADINNEQHVNWIRNYQDNNLAHFDELNWNTTNILQYIQDKKIKAVYFTKMGSDAPFGVQIQIVENFCDLNNILNFRLHTPSGQGLREGSPRINKLIHRWYHQGGNQFPFLCPNFDLNNFPWE